MKNYKRFILFSVMFFIYEKTYGTDGAYNCFSTPKLTTDTERQETPQSLRYRFNPYGPDIRCPVKNHPPSYPQISNSINNLPPSYNNTFHNAEPPNYAKHGYACQDFIPPVPPLDLNKLKGILNKIEELEKPSPLSESPNPFNLLNDYINGQAHTPPMNRKKSTEQMSYVEKVCSFF
ncbi:MAG: hypothetical protein HEEMFOPI_01463 [Holosporales bacterium]